MIFRAQISRILWKLTPLDLFSSHQIKINRILLTNNGKLCFMGCCGGALWLGDQRVSCSYSTMWIKLCAPGWPHLVHPPSTTYGPVRLVPARLNRRSLTPFKGRELFYIPLVKTQRSGQAQGQSRNKSTARVPLSGQNYTKWDVNKIT